MSTLPRVPKGSDKDESCFLLPPSRCFWITETTRGFFVICPPCYKKQKTQRDQEKNNTSLIKRSICSHGAPGKHSLSFKESTAFQGETLSSTRPGNRCCNWRMDSLTSFRENYPTGTSSTGPALQHASPAWQLQQGHSRECRAALPALEAVSYLPAAKHPYIHLIHLQRSAATRYQHIRAKASMHKPGTILPYKSCGAISSSLPYYTWRSNHHIVRGRAHVPRHLISNGMYIEFSASLDKILQKLLVEIILH